MRGICCLRPGRPGLSENIEVRSIVGEYLEHTRLFYFHHGGEPRVYAGSADMMVRSFDRRIEALFLIVNPQLKREAINILMMNMMDNQNSYLMREDGAYIRQHPAPGEPVVNVHRDFFRRDEAQLATATPEGLLASAGRAGAAPPRRGHRLRGGRRSGRAGSQRSAGSQRRRCLWGGRTRGRCL